MTMQVLLHRHIDEFCTNCSSCGGQGVTGGSLTLQLDPSAYQHRSLPMVVEKCLSEQILWDICVFLATETFVFYIQFLQNTIQYTTNNFPTTTWVEFNSYHRLAVSSKPCCSLALKLTQSPIQKLLLALTPTANFLEWSQYWGWESVKSQWHACTETNYIVSKDPVWLNQ